LYHAVFRAPDWPQPSVRTSKGFETHSYRGEQCHQPIEPSTDCLHATRQRRQRTFTEARQAKSGTSAEIGIHLAPSTTRTHVTESGGTKGSTVNLLAWSSDHLSSLGVHTDAADARDCCKARAAPPSSALLAHAASGRFKRAHRRWPRRASASSSSHSPRKRAMRTGLCVYCRACARSN
jgi:hypothetical protein